MPDNKLTDNEIIKALECCVSEQYTCEQCPYQEKKHYDYDKGFEIMPNGKQYDDWSCDRWLLTDALDLINRLQAENERLIIDLTNAMAKIAGLEKQTEWFTDIGKLYSEIKAEAYKEFAERLKEKPTQYFYETNRDMTIPLVSFDRIDNLLKELVGEDK